MSQPIVLDLETQKTFREVGGYLPEKLKISVVGIYDYATNKYLAFEENELVKLFPYLENASTIIGFNTVDFDLPVLKPYYLGQITKFPTLDLLQHVEKSLGFRIALDDLAKETLNAHKTGHGLLAIEYYREGKMQELKDYCLSDVRLTKDLYEYGKANKKVFFKTHTGRREISVDWGEIPKESASINLTMPF
jgi:predicted PolB exonuclease-like 3'-5' exonuclease